MRNLRKAGHDVVDDRLTIERVHQRLTSLDILEEGGAVRIEIICREKPPKRIERRDRNLSIVRIFDRNRMRNPAERRVDLSVENGVDLRCRFQTEHEVDAIENRDLTVVVIESPHRNRDATPQPRFEEERTGSDHALDIDARRTAIDNPILDRNLFPDMLGDDRADDPDQEHDQWHRLGCDHFDGEVIDLLERIHGAQKWIDERRIEVFRRKSIEGEHNVVGRKRHPVVPGDVVTKVKGVGHAVVGELPVVEKLGIRFGGDRIDRIEHVEHDRRHRTIRSTIFHQGIEDRIRRVQSPNYRDATFGIWFGHLEAFEQSLSCFVGRDRSRGSRWLAR